MGGGPTFHFANVVDDATMGVTHVLRAQEHLMNTPKHVAMFDALAIPRPNYAHMPLIFNADGTKMSKRDKAKVARQAAKAARLQSVPGVDPGALQAFIDKKSDEASIATAVAAALHISLPEINVHDFRASGYLKEVLLNYVALLGWSPKNNIERFNLDFLKQEFDLERIGKSNARFDRTKLLAFNGETLQKMPPAEFASVLRAHLVEFQPAFARLTEHPSFALFAEAYRSRSRTLCDPATAGRFFIEPDNGIEFDAKAKEKVLKANNGAGLAVLRELKPLLASCEPFDPPTIHKLIEEFGQKTNRQLGDVAQPLRVAVSGGTVSPPIHDTLAILGRESVLARIERCLAEVT
jgi:glutamyl/glutaminyl-tRNA synthetase